MTIFATRADGTTIPGWIRFYLIVYWPSRLRWWWHEALPWWIAMRLPRHVALLAFIRVYGVLGDCGPEFQIICDKWNKWNKKGKRGL